ncbi:MAG: hypothetical protein LCI00_33275 [Chloroflexi bacterium]|nr:hypothetical protein [Chloroflexota bacterium]MCC6896551.1 hypothetical protein [Anaerolineae bacterium]
MQPLKVSKGEKIPESLLERIQVPTSQCGFMQTSMNFYPQLSQINPNQKDKFPRWVEIIPTLKSNVFYNL